MMSNSDYRGLPEDYDLPLCDIQEKDIVDSDILLESSSCEEQADDAHPGNIYYLTKIQKDPKVVHHIQNNYSRWDAMDLARELVIQFRKEGIRFLAKEKDNSSGGLLWFDAGNLRMQVKISQFLRKRQTEHRIAIFQDNFRRQIQFTVVDADICDFEADVVAVKHAQDFFGADEAVASALEHAGVGGRNQFSCEPYEYRFKSTNGSAGIRANDVLFVGMPNICAWDYYQVQEFSRRTLEILQFEAPRTARHVAFTLHGFGLGLEQVECLLAQFRGCLIAIQSANCPTDLERITLVEWDSGRASGFQRVLEQVLSNVNFAERIIHSSTIIDSSTLPAWGGYRLIPSLIPPTHDPLSQQQQLQKIPGENNKIDTTSTYQFTKPSVTPSKWCLSSVHPSRWCINYEDLMDLGRRASSLYGSEKYPSITMRDICEDIIKPSCTRTGSSYALNLNEDGLPVDVFVSHSWDGHFAAFVESIRNAFSTSSVKPNLWICAFALVQVQGRDANIDLIAQQVGSSDDPLDECPFVLAIKEASMFFVVRNTQKDIYRRIWCVCELMYAKQCHLFPRKTHVTGPDIFLRTPRGGLLDDDAAAAQSTTTRTSVLDAEATRLEDRDRILRVLLTEFNRSEIDNFVHQLRTQETPGPVEFDPSERSVYYL